MCETIISFVEAGAVPSGFILAYGSLNHTIEDNLYELACKSEKVGGIQLQVLIDMMCNDTEKGYNRLGEKIAE